MRGLKFVAIWWRQLGAKLNKCARLQNLSLLRSPIIFLIISWLNSVLVRTIYTHLAWVFGLSVQTSQSVSYPLCIELAKEFLCGCTSTLWHWWHFLFHSDAQGWASECPGVKNYKWRLNLVWHSTRCFIAVSIWQQWASKDTRVSDYFWEKIAV